MMKKLLILLSFSLSLHTLASGTIIECLGREELVLHKKKSTGPLYKLNQYFIIEASALQKLSLKEKYFEKICGKGIKNSPSLGLLYYGLTEGVSIFQPVDVELAPSNRFLLTEMGRLIDSLPLIFFDYLSQIQAQAPSAACLKTEIPQLATLFHEYRYIGEDLDKDWIKTKNKEVTFIFSKLHQLKDIFAACEKREKDKEKDEKSK
ncbi:hypothetical protein [Bacteriovorax sp. BSW11_IV]|uniref:hypothetical protein n=1 Tax=Bacteriovorax sp. BSW11_IV TaxID=1353529 RepID=UPI00054F0764|nr:hypothetical protein [Bacteriovorax sp. BSW11_IV]